MWQRWGNWAAIALVGGFGLVWVGVVIFAIEATPTWVRLAQTAFGVMLTGWAGHKAVGLVRDALRPRRA